MAGIANKLYNYIKAGDAHKVQQLLGGIHDALIISEIEKTFHETDPVNLAINCREEALAIYLVEKGFSVKKLYQTPRESCDQWCHNKHRASRCPTKYDAADNAAANQLHRLKELIDAIRDGRRKPGDGLTDSMVLAGIVPHPHTDTKRNMDTLQAPGVKKEKPKSAAYEAINLLDRYSAGFADRHGHTLLHRVANSTPAHIYVLANRGVPVNVQNNKGDTALHLAVRADNFECAEALLQCSADLTVRNLMGEMPGDVAEKGPLKDMLLKCRPDPVECAMTGNGSMLIKHLRHNWCSVNSIVKDGKNLIQLAMSQSSAKPEIMNCCRILQEHRDTSELVHAVLSEDMARLEAFFNDHSGYSVNIRFKDQYGKTLLSHAVDSNNFEVVQLLVSAGAKINNIRVRDKSGRGPETVPLFFKSLRRDINPDITQFLYSVMDASELLEKDARGNTAILRAIEEHASEQVISWLLTTQNGLNVTHRNKDSHNARELAAHFGRQEIVNLIDKFVLSQRKKFFLINLPVHFYGMENLDFKDEHSDKKFADIVAEGRDEDDRKSISHYKDIENRGISLFEAASRGDLEQVQRLSVANFQDKNGYTALIRAIVFNQPEVAKYLCTSRPVLKSIPDNCNRYPLHYACSLPDGQDRAFVRILLERNPELIEKKVDKDGKYPVEYRAVRGTPASLQMLMDARTLDAAGVRGVALGPLPEGAVKKMASPEE